MGAPLLAALPVDLAGDSAVVDYDIARRVFDACQVMRDDLIGMKSVIQDLVTVNGMGTLKSGQDLARKFSLKAAGGDDSLEKSLDSHIQAVTDMRDYFQNCLDRYESVDAANATAQRSVKLPR